MKRYIDDQWRDILAAQGYSPRTEEGAEVWRGPGVDALIEITHSDKGDPLWLFYINRRLNQWLRIIGISVGEVTPAFHGGGTEMLG